MHGIVRRSARGPRRAAPLAAVLLSALVAGCLSDEPDTTQPGGEVAATVTMTSALRFDPATVTIKAGQAVRWKNGSDFGHTATADPAIAKNPADVQLPAGAQAFNSGVVSAGGEFVHVFDTPGTYKYFCIPHEGAGMVATVVVTQ
jgi:plastocyanin